MDCTVDPIYNSLYYRFHDPFWRQKTSRRLSNILSQIFAASFSFPAEVSIPVLVFIPSDVPSDSDYLLIPFGSGQVAYTSSPQENWLLSLQDILWVGVCGFMGDPLD
jgi:hypothetical protein